jgi:hypothetical protein
MGSNRLLSRIEKLEASLPPPREDLVIIRKIVAPGMLSPDYRYGECGDLSFDRLADESLEVFELRITQATRPKRVTGRGRRVVLFAERPGVA